MKQVIFLIILVMMNFYNVQKALSTGAFFHVEPQIVLKVSIGSKNGEVGILRNFDGYVEPGLFRAPSSFAVDQNGDIYLVDTLNSRIQIFSSKGEFIRSIDVQLQKNKTNYISDIQIYENGIFISDFTNGAVVLLDKTGVFQKSYGKFGKGNGEFIEPVSIYIDDNLNVSIQDRVLEKLLMFDFNTNLLIQTKDFGINVHKNNNFYFLRSKNSFEHELLNFNSGSGEIKKVFDILMKVGAISTDILGFRNSKNPVFKVFSGKYIFICEYSDKGKLINAFTVHNEPGIDVTRYQVLGKDGNIYLPKYKKNCYYIEKYEFPK